MRALISAQAASLSTSPATTLRLALRPDPFQNTCVCPENHAVTGRPGPYRAKPASPSVRSAESSSWASRGWALHGSSANTWLDRSSIRGTSSLIELGPPRHRYSNGRSALISRKFVSVAQNSGLISLADARLQPRGGSSSDARGAFSNGSSNNVQTSSSDARCNHCCRSGVPGAAIDIVPSFAIVISMRYFCQSSPAI